jgi:uncharacterized repeat protein (TIGR03803 family)
MMCRTGNRKATVLAALLIVLGVALAIPQPARAETFKVLHAFQGGTSDGKSPSGKLVLDASGNLYGLTQNGGAQDLGYGTVYKVDATTGSEQVLYIFTGGADGGYASGGLVEDAGGNLYGTTTAGGNSSCGGNGCGVVFKLDTSGKETALYQFLGENDGGSPNGDLVRDRFGNLYGTAYWGPYGVGGVVFKVDSTGHETVLHLFTGIPDGELPLGGLIRDSKGNFLGTTSAGGGGACYGGCGTVFELNKSGKETVLYHFLGSPDGNAPFAGLLAAAPGKFYGTTYAGGDPTCNFFYAGCGTVFEVETSGRERIVYHFHPKKQQALPEGGLIADTTGNLYGTTSDDYGTVFKLDTKGHETILYRFTGGDDGCFPVGDLTMDSAGNLYGVASECGSADFGTVYKIEP